MKLFEDISTEILAPAVVGLFIVALFLKKRSGKSYNFPPGPRGLPIVGYLPFKGKHEAKTYYNLSKQYGPVISVNLGVDTAVVLNDYDTIHEALVKNGHVFSGRPKLVSVVEEGTGVGIVTRTFDEDYKALRKFTLTSMRSFGFGKKSMEEKVNEELQFFVDYVESKNGTAFDCQAVIASSVSNVLSNITLGNRFPYEDEDFRRMVTVINDSFTTSGAAVALINLIPALRYIPPISGYYKNFKEGQNFIRSKLRKLIEDHESTFDPDNTRDFIDEFIKEVRRRGNNDPNFNTKQLVSVIEDLFVAGTETTSSALRWCILLFAHHPDIQKKVAEEVENVIGDSQPTMQHRDDMPYTQAFLHEMTRHRTLAILALPHVTTDDTIFQGYRIPKGTTVLPNLWAVHHDRENFENPEEFNPERYIDEDRGTFVPHKKVIPFSVGPRYCLGEQLAKMELFLYLTNIVQKFKIVPDSAKPLPSYHEGILGIGEVPPAFEVKYISR